MATAPNARGWAEGDLVTRLGDQGFASLAVLDATAILPVPAHVEPAHAIGEPVADLAEALGRAGLAAGQRAAVVGQGFMGLGLVQLALITHRFALDEVDRAYELMDSRAPGFVKAVLEP